MPDLLAGVGLILGGLGRPLEARTSPSFHVEHY